MRILNKVIQDDLAEAYKNLGDTDRKVFWNPTHSQLQVLTSNTSYQELRGGAVFVDGKWRVAVWPSDILTHWNFFNEASTKENLKWTDYFSFRVVNDVKRLEQEQFWVDELLYHCGSLFVSFYPAYVTEKISTDAYLNKLFPDLRMITNVNEAYNPWPEHDVYDVEYDEDSPTRYDERYRTMLHRDPWRGPHQFKELNLMLAGKKPIAMLEPHRLTKPWITAIKENMWTVAKVKFKAEGAWDYLVSFPEEAYRIKKIQQIYAKPGRLTKSDHVKLGRLLGYTKDQIKRFLDDLNN